MRLHRSAPFLRAYRFLPHRLLNRAVAALCRARRPRVLVQTAIRAWVRRDAIDLSECEPGGFTTVEELFLRRLRPGARAIGPGLVSPVDGRVVDAGTLDGGASLRVKGRPLSLDRLVNGRLHHLPLDRYEGGRYAVIFLSPRGYHRVHMPLDGEIASSQWIPGRFFPQNDDALRHIDGVYERNERLVLRCLVDGGGELLVVMVGASLVGGIHLEGVARDRFVRREPAALGLRRGKGEEIGHFTFGSTVVLLEPAGSTGISVAAGRILRMGESLG